VPERVRRSRGPRPTLREKRRGGLPYLLGDGTELTIDAQHTADGRLATSPAGGSVQIEPYCDADAEAVLRLSQLCLTRPDDALGAPLWVTRADMRRELAQWPVTATDAMFVAQSAGQVIGFAGVECHPGCGVALLHGPVVEPAARGAGIGRALYNRAVRCAVSRDTTELWATLGTGNTRGDALLRDEGFVRGDELSLYRLERGHHVAMGGAGLSLERLETGDVARAYTLVEDCCATAVATRSEVGAWLADPGHRVLAGTDGSSARAIVGIDGTGRWLSLLGSAPRGALEATALSAALTQWWDENPRDWLGMTLRSDDLAGIEMYRSLGFDPWMAVARYARAL
jgi:GNAT superfamily N-acetyltransferase